MNGLLAGTYFTMLALRGGGERDQELAGAREHRDDERLLEIDLTMKRKALETCEVGAPHREPTWKAQPDILAWLESL